MFQMNMKCKCRISSIILVRAYNVQICTFSNGIGKRGFHRDSSAIGIGLEVTLLANKPSCHVCFLLLASEVALVAITSF